MESNTNKLIDLNTFENDFDDFEGGLQDLSNNIELNLDEGPSTQVLTVPHMTEVWMHAEEQSFSEFKWYETFNNCGSNFPILPVEYDPATSILLGARGKVTFGYKTPA